MADSDNSKTLTIITRRNLLSSAAASIAASSKQLPDGTPPFLQERNHGDPALLLWQKWFETHQRSDELGRQQQRLETQLFEIVRHLPESERAKAWKAADKELGYSRAYKAEAESMDIEQSMLKNLWDTPAQSIVGVIAKLHSVIESEDPGSSLKITPWPELRSILSDLLRLDESGRAIQSIAPAL